MNGTSTQEKPVSQIHPSNPPYLSFLHLIGKLKHLKRTGWVRSGVKDPESVASHMYRMAIMAWIWGQGDPHFIKMALVHDMAESIIGDITPKCGVSQEEKKRQEWEAMQIILHEYMNDTEVGQEMARLFMEYEQGETDAARLVKEIDKLDMIIQADEYEQDDDAIDLEEFFDAKSFLTTESLEQVCETVMKQRTHRLQPSVSNR